MSVLTCWWTSKEKRLSKCFCRKGVHDWKSCFRNFRKKVWCVCLPHHRKEHKPRNGCTSLQPWDSTALSPSDWTSRTAQENARGWLRSSASAPRTALSEDFDTQKKAMGSGRCYLASTTTKACWTM